MSKHNKITWSITKKKVSELLPNDYNPNKMNESEKRDLKNSIKEFGSVVPVVLNIGSRNNILIGGEQRILAYTDLKIEEVDCMIPDRELTEFEEKELCLRLNKNVGHFDEDLLKEFNMDLLLNVGFGDEELQNLFDDVDVVEDDFKLEKALEETKVVKVKTGQIWELGEHRLLVGDSTNEEEVKKMMNGDLADICFLDPPFNISWNYGGKYGGEYKDNKSEEEYLEFISKSIETSKKITQPDSHFFCWSDPNSIGLIQSLYDKYQIKKRRVCFWVKSNQNCTPKIAWNRLYEPCIYGTIGTPYLNSGFRNANEILNQEVTSGNQVLEELQDMIDLWLVKRDNTSQYLHPTQKPVSLSEKPFKRCSAPNHIIFSGFAGSGSDLIACEELKRKWRGVEKDLVFATIVIDRWEKFTNKKAKLIYENN